jgi:hypothetical protein
MSGDTYRWIRAKLFGDPCWLFHPTIANIVSRAQEVGIIDMNFLWAIPNYWTYPETRFKQNSSSFGSFTDSMLDVAV